jgi:hypothetical protein
MKVNKLGYMDYLKYASVTNNSSLTFNSSDDRSRSTRSQFVHYVVQILSVRSSFHMSVCLSETLAICDLTFKPIETILLSLETPKY